MENCDAIIIGGGPAGSTCAWKLRRAGLDAVVIDKRAFPRDKTCAGWITPAVVSELELDTTDYAVSHTFQPITGFRVGTIGGATTTTRYEQPVSFGIRRCEFDHYLLQRSSARLRLGERIDTMQRDGEAWVVNGNVRAPLLIGAGGHFCPVARLLSDASGEETVVAAQEIEFELSAAQQAQCAVDVEVPELYFCRDLMGYAWCFRKGGYLNIGLGREDPARVSEHVADFVGWLKSNRRIPLDMPDKFHGHAYILDGHAPRPLVGDRVMLIGDSAGLAYPQSGEGIRPAVESALLAADVIVHANRHYGRAQLDAYARRMVARFGGREPQRPASSLLPAALQSFIASHLLATPWFARHVVVDRWFLHTQQSALSV